MKKGIILYVTEGKEEALATEDRLDLVDSRKKLDASAIMLATNEEEIIYGWWKMVTRGMQQIACVKATFDTIAKRVEPFGQPMRLWG